MTPQEDLNDVVRDLYDQVDPLAEISPELFEEVRGQVLAVDQLTNAYLWHAPTIEELPDYMPEDFNARRWCPYPGPPLKDSPFTG